MTVMALIFYFSIFTHGQGYHISGGPKAHLLIIDGRPRWLTRSGGGSKLIEVVPTQCPELFK